MNQTKYQNIFITLSNGKRATFTGEVLVDKKDENVVFITKIEFGEPLPLPEGYFFEKLNSK